ncbi:hypothetical protein Back11_35400 [Paenibacillus baekrokdamisoli]|uniref:Uncharacterized protein n=1 Tax=Paenibacillus baekrokdamisoli TaxID=1712516 RepID=A0A3G9J1E8_9BACL|nr:hypothetical protein [Paenibacillus baekrokdamisoli]MBB3070867.1 hypothetical protein [Paenibacillus baekrokdamisoli]BBH22195.1 hypothetical protein Back11_35400 [Paenibacillus baekrokdamisoli]
MRDDNKQQLDISDEDIDHAWERMAEKLKREPLSEFWSKSANEEHGELKHAVEQVVQVGQSIEKSISPQLIDEREVSLSEKKGMNRRNKPNRMTKRWLSLGMSALVAGLLLLSPWGKTVMASMLSTFRVQHLETVSISSSDLDAFREALAQGTSGVRQLDLKRYGEIEQQGDGPVKTVSLAEASAIAGHPLKTFQGVDSNQVIYQPQQRLIFKLHTKEINTLITLLGGQTVFPKSVNNKPIQLQLSGTFLMQASKKKEDALSSSGKSLSQFPAPSIEVPEGVDLEQVREAVLDLPILPDSIRSQLAGIGDWRHTLPLPTNGGDIRSVIVAGLETILSSTDHRRSLLWLQNGWVYELSGSLDDYPSDENLIQEAKGLIQS